MKKKIFQILSSAGDDPANFTSDFVSPIQLDPTLDYELALLSISIVITFYTIPQPLSIYYQLADSEQVYSVEVPAGNYTDLRDLLDTVTVYFYNMTFMNLDLTQHRMIELS
jgi:hypothetical protein